MPTPCPVWQHWYKGSLFPGYKSHHEARCKPCVDALVQQTLTLKLDAFVAGRQSTPARDENIILEEGMSA
ncbi:hypothetical protein PAXRUDRAFT_834560 [Paxillus rubicundulus Ve08.2h10]|uniref:Uncharacterized protein n=1 Tax=Paxillus rubicundulus Ve08.2h10 TaxID=930991 RepID=A0A0D0CSX6_9AGAM|nr:hypothetical protein PAXRUDRAFT_834560 [Paxillus rubicundulus Ve08.2h10]